MFIPAVHFFLHCDKPAAGVWARRKKTLANLVAHTTDELAARVRTRLERMQYRSVLLDGFIVEIGLIL